MIGVGTFSVTDKMRSYVNEVLDSGRISYGPKSTELEKKFSRMHACDYGVLSNSGTSSLQVALQAMKEIHNWGPEAEVIVPAVTFVATLNIVLHNDLTPVLVDVEPGTYNMDPMALEDALSKNTKAIIPVHLFGQPADVYSIRSIADEYSDRFQTDRIKIIEDSCECVLATHYHQPVGSLGDIGCFSTYVAHILTTGVGGMATTNNPEYAVKMRSLVNHGRDGIYISIDDDDGVSDQKRAMIAERRFKFVSVGHSFRITELEAALGLAQLDDLDEIIEKRNKNAEYLSTCLSSETWLQTPTTHEHNTHSFMMYPIVILEEPKWGLCHYLESNGVETREMLPLTNQPIYYSMFSESDYPVAEWINNNGFYVGCHQDLTKGDLNHIAETIRRYKRGL